MVKSLKGFTLIEVALFLAVTGALFVAVTIGVQNSIFQQRFNDSVQSFAEFLRGIYTEVTSVENLAGGRSERAIYGRLITFGETYGTDGTRLEKTDRNAIFVYDVVGRIGDLGTSSALEALSSLDANVIILDASGKIKPAGIINSYATRWAAQIENTDNYDEFKGAVLVVRHPNSGTVYTYVMKGQTIEINELISRAGNKYENILKEHLDLEHFKIESVDFCVNPNGDVESSIRRDVRIISGARNSSGVEVISTDTDNKCVIEK